MTVYHRHAGIDWSSSMKCPICHAEHLYESARSREQGERILRLRAERRCSDLEDAIKDAMTWRLPKYAREILSRALNAAGGEG